MNKKSIKFSISFILVIAIAWLSFQALNKPNLTIDSDDTDKEVIEKRVLFLSSYSPSYENFYSQIDGLESVFSQYNILLDVEFMDTKRLYTEENLKDFNQLFRYKIGTLEAYDAIIVGDDNATDYIMDNKEDLFPNIPIIFLGVNDRNKAIEYGTDPMVTGVVEDVSIHDTIKLAKTLNKDATRVVALVDNTTSGLYLIEDFMKQKEFFPELEMSTLNFSEMTLEDFAKELKKLGSNDIVLKLSTFTDITGKTYTYTESLAYILENISVPMYNVYYVGLNDGILGGKVITHFQQATQAALMAIEVFKGRNIDTIDVVLDSPNQYIIDYNVFKAYDLDEKLLPEETIFINKEKSLFEEYRGYFILGIVILLIQSLIILNLYRNIQLRKKVEEDLR